LAQLQAAKNVVYLISVYGKETCQECASPVKYLKIHNKQRAKIIILWTSSVKSWLSFFISV